MRLSPPFSKKTGIRYRVEKVWTTDGIYRETRDKAARRKA
ncbi:nucleoside phosphorylase [Enterocloster bolteae]|nr:nucleoside phosphorylase [Enterocloster bolteae]